MDFKWYNYGETGVDLAIDIRIKVFIDEQGYSMEDEMDDKDSTSQHVVGFVDGTPVCTARVFYDTPRVLHVGRIAVLKKCRGTGAGAVLMAEVKRYGLEKNDEKIILGAQVPKKGFYAKQGYKEYGDIFSDGGTPHIMMEKIL